jgi:hypothetical protein
VRVSSYERRYWLRYCTFEGSAARSSDTSRPYWSRAFASQSWMVVNSFAVRSKVFWGSLANIEYSVARVKCGIV